jgi:hypothetical protein
MATENKPSNYDNAPILTKILVWLIGAMIFVMMYAFMNAYVYRWEQYEKMETKRKIHRFNRSRWCKVR